MEDPITYHRGVLFPRYLSPEIGSHVALADPNSSCTEDGLQLLLTCLPPSDKCVLLRVHVLMGTWDGI